MKAWPLLIAALAAGGLGLWWFEGSEALPAVAAPPPAARALQPVASASTAAMAPAVVAAKVETAAVASLGIAPPAQALRTLTHCYATDSCRLTRGEGLDEHFEVVRLLLEQLDRLAVQGSAADQAAWARELLAFPDGHVQAAALALAARLPPSAETTAAAVAALSKTYDAVLLAKAYPVLRQWQQLGLSSGYDDMFIGLVHTGGWQAAQSVAENVGPFLNAGNFARFEQVARELQPGARQQALLRSLRDYELQRRGG